MATESESPVFTGSVLFFYRDIDFEPQNENSIYLKKYLFIFRKSFIYSSVVFENFSLYLTYLRTKTEST